MATKTLSMADSKTVTELSFTLFSKSKVYIFIKAIVFVFITTLSDQHVKFQIHCALKYVLFIPSQDMEKLRHRCCDVHIFKGNTSLLISHSEHHIHGTHI